MKLVSLSDFRTPMEDRHGLTAQGTQLAQEREERIQRYRQRADKRLPLFEDGEAFPPECGRVCMGCDKPQPPGANSLRLAGWKSRSTTLAVYVHDVVCPDCFEEHGWWEEADWSLIFPRTKGRHR
jgi:hypothetical protein